MPSSPRQPRLDRSFEEQAQHYCELLKEPKVSPDAITVPGQPELGFMSVEVDDFGRLWVQQLYGDVKFWGEFAISMGRRLNTKIYFTTNRRTRAYRKLFGAKEIATIMEVDPWAEQLADSVEPSEADSEVRVRPAAKKISPDKSSEVSTPPSLHLVQGADG